MSAHDALPAMGLTPPPTRQPAPQGAALMGLHLLYGGLIAPLYEAL